MAYTITVKSYSSNTAVLTLTRDTTLASKKQYRIKIFSDSEGSTTIATSIWKEPEIAATSIDFTFSSINPGLYYAQAYNDDPEDLTSIVAIDLPDDTPKTATQYQWEDLASRIKAKANSSDVPTFTMTSTDPGEGSALAENHFVAVYGGDPIITDYFTSEKNTGVKWIDGSAIYKKTINFGALPNATNKTVAHGITNLSRVIKLEGYSYRSSDSVTYPIPFSSNVNVVNNIGVTVTSTDIDLGTGSDRSNITECYITLYYTKSS